MTLKTQIETAFGMYGAASVLEELIERLRDDAKILNGEYPVDSAKRLKLADKLAGEVELARSIQN